MIVYENRNRLFSRTGYDKTYSDNLDRFSHKVTFQALDEILSNHLSPNRRVWCLDLGCGQGQVLNHVRDEVIKRTPGIMPDSRFYGIDISHVAIQQCNRRYPDCLWIVDSFQDFLLSKGNVRDYRDNFSLVINKGGLTHVQAQQEYEEMLTGIHSLLAPGGKYLLIKNKKFYRKWSNETCDKWPNDIFDIGEEIFGTPDIVPNYGYYIFIYTRHHEDAQYGSAERNRRAKPARIEFQLNDGTTESTFISGDELMYTCMRALPGCSGINWFPEPDCRVGGKENEPVVLLSNDTIGLRSANLRPGLTRAFRGKVAFVRSPRPSRTSRNYCRDVFEWVAACPDMIILGCGMRDFLVNPECNKPDIDLDEYSHRIDWVLARLKSSSSAEVLWILAPPLEDFHDLKRGRIYNQELAKEYNAAATRICRNHKVTTITLNLADGLTQKDLKLIGNMESDPALVKSISALLDIRD